SKPTFVYLLCPPLCGPFSIQESAAGGLSYKVKMATWYKINASAKLTVRADSLNVRSGPQLYDFVKSVKAGEVVQATERALISGDPWFHISDGWISGKYV
ncbi:MAG: SH3 domain-containing protein, partial [Lachnospiraceae bacterium]|nr:SH3 domain-containing protein [Lachnospiraceae bacterium]